ncbi:MAG: hypothetical protein ACYCT0_04750, partial [Sulfobacillus sp.]
MAQRGKAAWNRKDWLWVGGGAAVAVGLGAGAVALSRRDKALAAQKAAAAATTTTTITTASGTTITASAPSTSTGTSSASQTTTTTSGQSGTSATSGQSGTSATATACGSPYGCDQSAGPVKACPSGFASVFTAGYGWGCQETAAGYQAAFQQFLAQLGPDGVSVSGAPMLPGGSLTTEAQAIASYLQSHYHTTYDVLPQKNG